MSYYRVDTPSRSKLAWGVAAAGVVALAAIAALAGWAAGTPQSVYVDGREQRVRAGTTVAELEDAGLLAGKRGDLLGVDGSVVADGGGLPPAIVRNGRVADPEQRLYSGDAIRSRDGADRTERLVTATDTIEPEVVEKGAGPFMEVEREGKPGVKRVLRGEYSGAEVSSTVVIEPTPTVYVRTGRTKAGTKLVALTFDDGPWPNMTKRILDVLKQEKVPATFFVLGNRVGRHPDLVKRAHAEGHQVASHSYSHPSFVASPNKEIARQVTTTQRRVRGATGETIRWIRPPYGATDRRVMGQLHRMKQHVVLWDVDPQDWRRPGTKTIVRRVVGQVKPGSVVLLHDGGGDRVQTARALPAIVRELKKKGYTFVTVEQLAAANAANGKK